jgi:aminopeptidase
MSSDFEQMLAKYAELTVKVGLNLQPGQRLLVKGDALVTNGVSLHMAPLVQRIAAVAYQGAARLVDVIWGDEQLQLARFRHAPRDSFTEFPTWQANAALEYAQRGDAFLTILADNPDLLTDQDPELVATFQTTALKHTRPYRDYIMRDAINWTVIAGSTPDWAARVFPDLPPPVAESKLWEAIFEMCRLNHADPVAAWQTHLGRLAARSDYLNCKRYAALKFTAPGTDLTVGLPAGHIWKGGHSTSQSGIAFTANMPTEEIFTLPHKDKTEGVVAASMPLSHGGALIENFSLTFAQGQVVRASADKGEAILCKMLETDAGAGRLGEVALVPHSSPISQSGLLFYNSLIDENAASHIALGRAYRFSLQGGQALSDAEFAALGGNYSLTHVDFMIGSAHMYVDGLQEDGAVEPITRNGEWAFEV